jgi:hypothetical protein
VCSFVDHVQVTAPRIDGDRVARFAHVAERLDDRVPRNSQRFDESSRRLTGNCQASGG